MPSPSRGPLRSPLINHTRAYCAVYFMQSVRVYERTKKENVFVLVVMGFYSHACVYAPYIRRPTCHEA